MATEPKKSLWGPLNGLSTLTTIAQGIAKAGPFVVAIITGVWAHIEGLAASVVFVFMLVAAAAVFILVLCGLSVFDWWERRTTSSHRAEKTVETNNEDRTTESSPNEAAGGELQRQLTELQEKFDAQHAEYIDERDKAWKLDAALVAATREAAAHQAKHEDKVRGLEFLLDGRDKKIHALRWRLEYHDEYPEISQIDDADLRSMIPQLDQCVATMHRAAKEGEIVLSSLLDEMTLAGGGNTPPFLARFVRKQTLSPLARTTHLLDDNKSDPRSAIITFSARYHIGRVWIRNCLLVLAEIRDHTDMPEQLRILVADTPHYRDWWSADQSFFDELEKLLTIRHLADVKKAISDRDKTDGFARTLPVQMRPA